MLRLLLLRHGPTATTASATFGDDGELTQRGAQQAAALELPRARRALRSPALAAAATARAIELNAEPDAALADWDAGRWRGRTLEDVAAHEPEAAHAWRTDPGAAPHGGESLAAVLARTERWLGQLDGADGTLIAITHAAIVRAAVVAVLGAPPAALWALDVAPLSVTELRHHDGRWALRGVNR